MGVLSLAFMKKREGQSTLLPHAVFQVSVAQNNPFAEGEYFEVACSSTLYVPSV